MMNAIKRVLVTLSFIILTAGFCLAQTAGPPSSGSGNGSGTGSGNSTRNNSTNKNTPKIPDRRCSTYNLKESNEDLDGFWKLTFTANNTAHTTLLGIKGNKGISYTTYYDSQDKVNRKIQQYHLVCKTDNNTVVIMGFDPIDAETNRSAESMYSADNYFIFRDSNRKIRVFNNDDKNNRAEVDIKFLGELNSLDKVTENDEL
jgi:hypothetical protein